MCHHKSVWTTTRSWSTCYSLTKLYSNHKFDSHTAARSRPGWILFNILDCNTIISRTTKLLVAPPYYPLTQRIFDDTWSKNCSKTKDDWPENWAGNSATVTDIINWSLFKNNPYTIKDVRCLWRILVLAYRSLESPECFSWNLTARKLLWDLAHSYKFALYNVTAGLM